MLRLAAAAVLAVHGLIHLIGFVVPWELASVQGYPLKDSVLSSSIAVSDMTVHVLGVLWLVAAIGFVVAAVGLARRATWSIPLIALTSVVSIVLCVLGSPEAAAGAVMSAAILLVLGVVGLQHPSPSHHGVH